MFDMLMLFKLIKMDSYLDKIENDTVQAVDGIHDLLPTIKLVSNGVYEVLGCRDIDGMPQFKVLHTPTEEPSWFHESFFKYR